MSAKRKSCVTLITLLVVLLILPLVAMKIVSSAAGMVLCFILFFAINPFAIILLSIMAGTEIRKLWWVPILAAGVFPVFFWIAVMDILIELYGYSVIYLAIGLIAMIGTHYGMKLAKRTRMKEGR